MIDTATVQEAPPPSPANYKRGIFGTGIPTAVALLVGVLLFLLPFVEIRCNTNVLKNLTGVELATGFRASEEGDNTLVGQLNSKMNEGKVQSSTDRSDLNYYALVALIAGVIGIITSFAKGNALIKLALVLALVAAGGLIGLWIQVTLQVKDEVGQSGVSADQVITVIFTSWFWLALLSFLAAAFLSYQHLRAGKNNV